MLTHTLLLVLAIVLKTSVVDSHYQDVAESANDNESFQLDSLEDLRLDVESKMRSMGMLIRAKILVTENGLELIIVPDPEVSWQSNRSNRKWKRRVNLVESFGHMKQEITPRNNAKKFINLF